MREMKDSGVELFGSIPQNWTVTTVKREYDFQTGWTPDTKNEANFVGDNIWVNISDLKEKVLYDSAKHISDEAVENASMDISPKGSLLYAFKLSVGAVSFCGTDMYTNEAIATFLPGKNSLRFLYYIAPIYIVENANENIYGAKLLNQQLIQNAKILMPPIEEQERIADYLDIKCAKIDSIIEKQQAIIEKLKEYKLSVITEAVTKGLNPNVEMKDSGNPEIGFIPADWVPTKIKYICNTQGRIGFKGYTTADLVDENEGAYTLGASHLANGKVDLSSPVYISWEKYYESPEIMVKRGDILIVQRGSTIGKVGIVDLDYGEMTINPSLVLINSIKIENKYLLYALLARYIVNYINLIGTTTAIPMISQKQINDLIIMVPSGMEQRDIVNYLDKKCDEIDNFIIKKEKQVEKLQEYKKSLIYEVVTGKKEV